MENAKKQRCSKDIAHVWNQMKVFFNQTKSLGEIVPKSIWLKIFLIALAFIGFN